jgi:hypothetical protein
VACCDVCERNPTCGVDCGSCDSDEDAVAEAQCETIRHHARTRSEEAYDERYKHARASRAWARSRADRPQYAPLYDVLEWWMAAREEVDARAEQAFRQLAALTDEALVRRIRDAEGGHDGD